MSSDDNKQTDTNNQKQKDYEKIQHNILSADKNSARIFVQEMPKGDDFEDTGLVIKDAQGQTFVQHAGIRGGGIRITGDNVRDNGIHQWHGGHNTVYMKDGENITGNNFDAGGERGTRYKFAKLVDLIEQPLMNALGSPTPRRLENDTIILEGKREDYQFTFNDDYKPHWGNYGGSVDIAHRATGATNNFTNFEYVIFAGDPKQYVELSQMKAEQQAAKEQAEAAVKDTRGKVTPASETASRHLPPTKDGGLVRQ